MARSLTAKYPPEAQYHWFFDAAWQLEQVQKYLPNRMNEIRGLVNSGQFGYNPLNAHHHSMYLTNEQLMRLMSAAGFGATRIPAELRGGPLRRSHGQLGLRVDDGFRRRQVFSERHLVQQSLQPQPGGSCPAPLFRWTGPDGQQVLCFYYDGYAVMAQGAVWGGAMTV